MTDAPVREIMCTNVVVLFTGRDTENRHSERMSCNTQLKLLKQVRENRGSKTTPSFFILTSSTKNGNYGRSIFTVCEWKKISEFVCD